MRMTVVLRGGAEVEADIEEITRTVHPVTHETTGFTWTHGQRRAVQPGGGFREVKVSGALFYLRVEAVDAIVVHRMVTDPEVADGTVPQETDTKP